MTTLTLLADSNPSASPVYVGDDLPGFFQAVRQPRWTSAAVVGDSTTLELFSGAVHDALRQHGLSCVNVSFSPGEAHKTRATKERLEDELLAHGIDRHTCVVGLGGGIALDMAGFVASTLLRGLPTVYIATTLLAQVDAALGGKTGVNTPLGKNLVGSFHPPCGVLLPAKALQSLPQRELKNGLAEMVKHAVIGPPELLNDLQGLARSRHLVVPGPMIARSASLKLRIVRDDPLEQGLRTVLNFGHTIGHALEHASRYDLLHGEAVAFGMLIEAWIAHRVLGFPLEEFHTLLGLMNALELLASGPLPMWDELQPFLKTDKKNRGGQIRFALPVHIGQMYETQGDYSLAVDRSIVEESWHAGLQAISRE